MEQSTLAIIIVLLAIVSFALEKIPVALTAILRHWQWPYLGLLITVKHIRISVLRRL